MIRLLVIPFVAPAFCVASLTVVRYEGPPAIEIHLDAAYAVTGGGTPLGSRDTVSWLIMSEDGVSTATFSVENDSHETAARPLVERDVDVAYETVSVAGREVEMANYMIEDTFRAACRFRFVDSLGVSRVFELTAGAADVRRLRALLQCFQTMTLK